MKEKQMAIAAERITRRSHQKERVAELAAAACWQTTRIRTGTELKQARGTLLNTQRSIRADAARQASDAALAYQSARKGRLQFGGTPLFFPIADETISSD